MDQSKTLIVCVKQVPDSEGPDSLFSIDPESGQVKTRGLPPVISPYDENALEVALGIKERHGGTLKVISAGSTLSKSLLRKVLAVGADELILVDTKDMPEIEVDSFLTAWILAKTVKALGSYDLIFTGCQAADTNAGLVGLYMAQILDIPSVSLARDLDINDTQASMCQTTADGVTKMRTELPVLVSIGQDSNPLRPIGLKELRAAKKKPVIEWKAGHLFAGSPPASGIEPIRFFKPERQRDCRYIEEASPEASGKALALRLREIGLV